MSKANWETKTLKKLCSAIGDGIHATPNYINEPGYYFINGNNLKDGFITFTKNTKQVSREEYKKYYIELDDNTLLMSINGTLGSLALFRGEQVILGKSAAYINCESINRLFCYYYLQLDYVQKKMWNEATGSTIKNLSLDSLNNLSILVPKPEEQQQIAAVLAALDAKIELNNRINAELETMAKKLYDYWFVQFDFPDKNGKPYKSIGGKMVWNAKLKREIPDGWESGSLFDIGDIVAGSTPSTSNTNNFSESGTPWITPKDLSNRSSNKFISRGEIGVTENGINSASLKVYPKGTVLLSSRAPIGYMAIARNPVTTNQGFKSFVPNKGYSSQFIYYTIKNSMKTIIQYASGSTFKEISGTVIKTIKVCLPKKDIVNNFTQNVSQTFERQNILEQENQTLSELRDWLLPILMNGQVKVA
jgi:type I restriction enzyme, S subunit